MMFVQMQCLLKIKRLHFFAGIFISYVCCAAALSAQPPNGNIFNVPAQRELPAALSMPLPEETGYAHSPLAPANDTGELYLSSVPNDHRQGMFQKVNFNVLWVPSSGGGKGLGMTELDIAATFALPLPTPDSPLVITPSFKPTFFDVKRGSSETFYTTGVNFRWIRPVSAKKLTADLGAGVFYSGDFKATGRDAIRIPAHLAGIWGCNPRLKIIFGVAYLDRKDSYNVLPMAGLIWTPQEDLSVELVFPRLRIAERINWFGTADNPVKADWFYGAFEFAGGSWGYEPLAGMETTLDYHDMRLLIGLERKTSCGFTWGLETGYMFDRTLESYASRLRAADSVFLRLRTAY
ncbi:MAG: hypothetical protein LBT46_05330 [Planctomycetaceae bacterium]|jgi:hypothetical protein|nr:hypothetical protein [Planctomycetaceae bacterium]